MSEMAQSIPQRRWTPFETRAWLGGLALVVLADVLIWKHTPNLGLFLFFAAVSVAILFVRGAVRPDRTLLVALGVALLGALPLLEALSWWGVFSATFGAGVVALAASRQMPATLPRAALRFGLLAPFRLIADAGSSLFRLTEAGLGGRLFRGAVMWIVPLVLAGVFIGLFSAANPLIESALLAVNLDSVLGFFEFGRVTLWLFAICFAWPFLMPRLLEVREVAEMQGPHRPRPESVLFGQGAILRALILFNALFAVQTLLDIAYLWGGVVLPEGMTYANYAPRGAYPLIVTALLAAAFVLAAMRTGSPAAKSPLIRALVYAFIAQNVMLVVSSILRLDLYVEVYSLTGLRVAAGIWMGLVAIGLLLILARIVLGKSNKWLVATNLAILGITLYGCAWIDFGALIARYNVDHSLEMTGKGTALDSGYFWRLGPSAIPALDHLLGHSDMQPQMQEVYWDIRHSLAASFDGRDRSWQGWSYRAHRLDQYLAAPLAQPADAARSDSTSN